MKKVSIKTQLVQKDELFKILALAHSCQVSVPVLFIGLPGVAKSQVIRDYMNSFYGDEPNLIFQTQLNGYTKGSDITGRVDLKQLAENKTYHKDRPICRAKAIFVDEVGRGSSDIRNTLLSIMNEKEIIDGSDSCKMNWEVFVGATNTIPTEELKDAFWD